MRLSLLRMHGLPRQFIHFDARHLWPLGCLLVRSLVSGDAVQRLLHTGEVLLQIRKVVLLQGRRLFLRVGR